MAHEQILRQCLEQLVNLQKQHEQKQQAQEQQSAPAHQPSDRLEPLEPPPLGRLESRVLSQKAAGAEVEARDHASDAAVKEHDRGSGKSGGHEAEVGEEQLKAVIAQLQDEVRLCE